MTARVLAPVLCALVLAAGCGGSGDGGDAGRAPDAGATASAAPTHRTDPDAKLPEVTAGMKFGEKPTVRTEGDPPPGIRFEVLDEGDGPVIRSGEVLVADFELYAWGDHESSGSSFGSVPLLKVVGTGGITRGWDTKIPGTRVGSRVLLVEQAETRGAGLDGRTLVFVIDILDALAADKGADGDAIDVANDDLPEVTGSKDPAIEVPSDTDPPKQLVDEVLIRGDGPEVKKGQLVAVQYTGVLWRRGIRFDSSWHRTKDSAEPLGFQVGEAGVIPAWSEGLLGKKVGSRVLLVVPPDKGYGDSGQPAAGIRGDDTMVFVVDIIGAYGGRGDDDSAG